MTPGAVLDIRVRPHDRQPVPSECGIAGSVHSAVPDSTDHKSVSLSAEPV